MSKYYSGKYSNELINQINHCRELIIEIEKSQHEENNQKKAELISELHVIYGQLVLLMNCLNNISSELQNIPECEFITKEYENTAGVCKSTVDIFDRYFKYFSNDDINKKGSFLELGGTLLVIIRVIEAVPVILDYLFKYIN